jgi:cytidylate kinase
MTLRLARYLGWHTLDSGALYRLVALSALRQNVPLDDVTQLIRVAQQLQCRFLPTLDLSEMQVWLDDCDVSHALRTETCASAASQIAAYPAVRTALLDKQKDFRQSPGLVADGRDMGTVVFPQASLKIFLTASCEKRAQRRYKQLKEKGVDAKLATLIEEIKARDARDQSRSVAPLQPATDAWVIDTTEICIEQVLALILHKVSLHLGVIPIT